MDVIPVGSPIVPEVIEKVSTSVLKQIQVVRRVGNLV